MMDLPNPPPDRRLQKQNRSPKIKEETTFSSNTENSEKEKFEKYNSMNIVKIKHIEDMRKNILDYKILNDKKMYLNFTSSVPVNNCNIIVFGPSGSGKSSFIKTLYRAVYSTAILPPKTVNKLVIKNQGENEGTVNLTRFFLKGETETSSGIVLCDTRGHIWMDENEKEQLKVIIDGKVKDDQRVEQKSNRNPLFLWEFWKRDSELFPSEIFKAAKPGLTSIPHSVVLVFDGSTDKIINEDDEQFYKEIIDITYQKGYNSVHVILTRLDIFEKQILSKNTKLHPSEQSSLINSSKDTKIQKVMNTLGIKRTNVHFLENYHDKIENSIVEIDYDALKTLTDIINLAEQFILNYMNKNVSCFSRCFP